MLVAPIFNASSNFIKCKFFLESSSLILALCGANLDHSIHFSNFSARGYLLLIWKDSVTAMNGLAVYVWKGLFFAQDLSLENPCLCFQLGFIPLMSYFFFLYWSMSSFLCIIFDAISSNIDRFSQSSNLPRHLSLETLSSIIRTGWSILVNLSQIILCKWLPFPTGSLIMTLTLLLFWIYFFLLTLVSVLPWFLSIRKFWS